MRCGDKTMGALLVLALAVVVTLMPISTYGAETPSCADFSKGSFSGNVTDKDICRTACEKAEGMCCPDFKGVAGAAQCQCTNRESAPTQYRSLCEDVSYSASSSAAPSRLCLVFLSGILSVALTVALQGLY